MMHLLMYCLTLIPITISRINFVTARTTLRLWHDLHVEKKIAHDFDDIFDPNHCKKSVFVAAIMNDEIKAIVQCNRNDDSDILMRRMAHAPHHEVAGDALIQLLVNHISIEYAMSKTQPRWFLAYNFYKTNEEEDETSEKKLIDFDEIV